MVRVTISLLVLSIVGCVSITAPTEPPPSPTPATSSAPLASPTPPPVATSGSPGPTDGGTPTVAPSVATTATPSASQPPPTSTPTPNPSPTPSLPVDGTLDAALARCPTAAEIAFVDARITLTFIDDPTARKLVCRARDGSANLTRLQERAYQAVLTMRRIKFDKPLPWTDRSMLGWFTHATTGIRFEYSDYSHYDLADEVIVIRSQTDMAYLGDNHWESRDEYHQYGLSSLVGLLVHEARHGDGYFHNCGYSEAAGAFGDDQTMEEMGAWAVAALYYKWIAEHSDVDYMTPVGAPSELYREQAAQAAESIMANRICDNYENTQ